MEHAISFSINNQNALGIIHQPENAIDTAVLIVVGGPQYRVGSHRQFVQLSRYLANNNISSMRFDYRGMGDSYGEKQTFDCINDDIKAAIDAMKKCCPEIKKIVLWGLCDAASASLIYAPTDNRVSGLVLLNPWLQDDQAMAKTMLKFYYLKRLSSKAFWRKLISGKVKVGKGLGEAKGFLDESRMEQKSSQDSYQNRMVNGLNNFTGNLCLLLSGNDLTSREFQEQVNGNKRWRKMNEKHCETHHLPDADHTFSSREFKNQVADISMQFIKKIG